MRRKDKLPELLAPAGDLEALYAAVEAGADAIYVGGKRFGARAFAKNFDDEELKRAVRYCHLHGVKLYVTVNTLIFDREIGELSDFAAFLYEIGVDAIIVADLGALKIIKERVPDLELHASTQMCVHSTEGAKTAAELGCSRVVLARELALSDIDEITADAPAETEVFLHGALCVCHSGQCLFSSLVGGRSGNRGECAQPCRLPYNGGRYPLSLSDLSLADHIQELISSGTASLKIEGRMKSADYVYGVTRIYRRLLDEGRNASAKEKAELARIFSRGGFTDGYFTGKYSGMTGVRTEEDKSKTRELSGKTFAPMKKRVRASAVFKIGMPAELTLTANGRAVRVTGDTVREAISAPLCDDEVRQRLSKMGNTLLELYPEDIELTLDDGANLSPGAVNALRRSAAEKFESAEERKMPPSAHKRLHPLANDIEKTALFLRPEVLTELKDDALREFDAIFAPLFADDAVFEVANGVYLPPVLRNSDFAAAEKRLAELKEKGVLYTLVGNLGHIHLSLGAGFEPVADFRMNVTNSYTRRVLSELGVRRAILSSELDIPKARDVGGAVVSYGRIPLMLTERCFISESFSCSECGETALTDRRGKRFPMLREYAHRNLILNSETTYMADRAQELRSARLTSHFIFSTETADEVERVVVAYAESLPYERVFAEGRARRLGMRKREDVGR